MKDLWMLLGDVLVTILNAISMVLEFIILIIEIIKLPFDTGSEALSKYIEHVEEEK